MADFFFRRDLAAVTDFTDPEALFDFSGDTREQTVHNDSPAGTAVLEVSFDGTTVHARLQGSGPSKVIHWGDHTRRRLFVRRAAGGSGSSRFVEVLAHTS